MKEVHKELDYVLSNVRTIDPHCHLNVEHPSANNLADLILYHHVWIELISCGMGQQEVSLSGLPQELRDPEISTLERVSRALRYLPNIKNTTLGIFLRWLLMDLYEIEELTEANLRKAVDLVEVRGRNPDWLKEVLQTRCGLEYNISVETEGKPCTANILKGKEVYVTNITSGKQSPLEILRGWENMLGAEITSWESYKKFLEKTIGDLAVGEYKFIGLWVLPNINNTLVGKQQISRIFTKIKKGETVNEWETGSICYFGFHTILELLRKTPLHLIQLLVGADVYPPHRSITHWNGNFCGSIAKIANDFHDFHFNTSTASDLFTQDLGILAKHVPNISVAGYWWHTLYPFYLRKAIETRLDMVPLNKNIAFFSDAYHAEWCYPKLKMIKQLFKEILSDRINKGWYDVAIAKDIISALFYENPKRIYQIL